MEELIEKVDNLINEIDNLDYIKKIKELNEMIYKDKELLNNIEKYNMYKDENLRKKIISNNNYLEYKKCEAEINYLILKINKELKTIKPKGSGCVAHN